MALPNGQLPPYKDPQELWYHHHHLCAQRLETPPPRGIPNPSKNLQLAHAIVL
jgi:hypothetical protein